MSVKPLTMMRSTVAALALAFGLLAALSPPVAAAPDAPSNEGGTLAVARPQSVARHSLEALPKPMVQPPPQQAVALSPAAQHFLAAVRANFAQWDRNHDGVLRRDEIELDMQDAAIVGDAAAALAALKLGSTRYDHLAETRSFTLADIDAMERRLATGAKLTPDFVGFYVAGLKKLEQQPRQLFIEGIPHLSAIRQDFTSDCYFLSAAGALAQVNPQALVRLIAKNRDGSFTVTFPDYAPVRVPAPTDAEIATYTISKDGIWLSVLQKAFALLRIEHEPNAPSTREPLDSVGFRTGSTQVLDLLTGHPSREITFRVQDDGPYNLPSKAHLAEDTRAEIQSALRDRRGIVLASRHHAYTIVAYDADNDLVTVHDPYDRGGFEAWISGDKVRRTEDGFFVISTARLVANFQHVRFEESDRVGS